MAFVAITLKLLPRVVASRRIADDAALPLAQPRQRCCAAQTGSVAPYAAPLPAQNTTSSRRANVTLPEPRPTHAYRTYIHHVYASRRGATREVGDISMNQAEERIERRKRARCDSGDACQPLRGQRETAAVRVSCFRRPGGSIHRGN